MGVSTAVSAQLCRLVIYGPDRRAELAVPATVPIADLLPTLLGHLGPQLADTGLDHEGWVLQRLGEPPLDEDASISALGLTDGETLYLRPRDDQIPPADFDDLIDGIATGMSQRPAAWRPDMTRWAGLTVLALILGVGLAVVALPGPVRLRIGACVLLTVLWLIGAAIAARAAQEPQIAVVLAIAAVGYAALGGLLIPERGVGSSTVGLPLGTSHVWISSSTALGVCLLGALVVGRAGPWFAALSAASVVGLGAMASATMWGLSDTSGAGIAAVAASVLVLAVPLTAFRLSGMRLPPLPTTPEHLQEDIDPEASVNVLTRTRAADRYMTGMYLGLAVAGTLASMFLAVQPGWAPRTLVGLLAVTGLLAARPMTSGWHRLAAGLPALVAGPVLTVTVAGCLETETRLGFAAVAAPVMAIVMVGVIRVIPVRRLTPYWGRVGDIFQTLTTVAQLPVLLVILGVYGAARGLGG